MTEPDPEDGGQGSLRTYLVGARAEAHMDADVSIAVEPALPEAIAQNYFYVDVDPYTVQGGKPQGRPDYHCRMMSRVGIGAWEYSDQPPMPREIVTGAASRWLPDEGAFLEGERWDPSVGGGFHFGLEVENTPYLDTSYSWAVRGGDEVEGQAVVFSGNTWMTASDRGWSANAFTLAMIAVFHPNEGGGRSYGVFSSMLSDVDSALSVDEGGEAEVDADAPPPPVDWGLRYQMGMLHFFAGSVVVSHGVNFPLGRPVMVAVSMDNREGKLFVCDRTKSSRSFSTAGMNVYDQELVVGRQRGRTDVAATAQMDVLELNWFDRALSWEELAELLHDLDAAYGIVG